MTIDRPDEPDAGSSAVPPVEIAGVETSAVEAALAGYFAREAASDAEPSAAPSSAPVALTEERALASEEVELHDRRERRLLWKEVGSITFVVVVIVIRHFWLV